MVLSSGRAVAAIRPAVILVAVLSVAAPARAQAPAHIAGAVSDATGAGLPGASVVLTGADNRTAVTADGGRFRFENLQAGDYEVTVTLPGFARAAQVVRATAGETTTLAIALAVQFLERVIVSADRTGERDAQQTPMAVTALSRTTLDGFQVRTVEHMARLAPSVTFSQHTGLAQVSIRGVGTNAVFAGGDPSSAVYLDGVYLARPAMALMDLVDLDRAEVLRGPQGTLYGRNTVGGAINLFTRSPVSAPEASLRLTAGTLDTLRVDGRASGPLIRNRVFGSVAFARGVSRGFVRDISQDVWLGGEDVTAARARLLFVLDRRADLLVSGDVAHSDPPPLTYAKVIAVKPGFVFDNPVGPLQVRASTPATGRQRQSGGSARLTLRMPRQIAVTSLSAYRAVDYDVTLDTDITELNLTSSRVHEIQHQWSEEATVARQGTRTRWIGGVFLFGDVDRQPTTIQMIPQRVESRTEAAVTSRAAAAFAQGTVALARRVSATAGLRYTHERKTIDNETRPYTLTAPFVRLPGGFAYTDAASHSAWTPKVGIDVRTGADTLIYASATRGFKSGGFNLSSPEAGRGFAPEWLWSYEGGVKATVLGGRGRLSAAVFEMNYQDLQVQTAIRPGVIDISNAAAATVRGIEWEAGARVARWLEIGGHLAWLDARYDRYIAVGVGGATGDVAGHRLNNAPEWSGRISGESRAVLGRLGSLSARAAVTRQSTVFYTPFNDAVQRQPAFGLLDAAAELAPRGQRWSVGIFCQNLADARYLTGTFSSPPPAIGGRPGQPRRIGVQVRVWRGDDGYTSSR
jgi:iron complex outermembrane recepter protein